MLPKIVIDDEGEINRDALAVRIIPQLIRKLTIKGKEYVRYTAYTSEVGEATRQHTTKLFVNSMYALSFAYVFADVGNKVYHHRHYGNEYMKFLASDQLLWHGMASLAFPSLVIHQIVHQSQHYLVPHVVKYTSQKVGRYFPLVLGLGCIPLIIHPIDVSADFVMNQTFRKYWWGNKIHVPHH